MNVNVHRNDGGVSTAKTLALTGKMSLGTCPSARFSVY